MSRELAPQTPHVAELPSPPLPSRRSRHKRRPDSWRGLLKDARVGRRRSSPWFDRPCARPPRPPRPPLRSACARSAVSSRRRWRGITSSRSAIRARPARRPTARGMGRAWCAKARLLKVRPNESGLERRRPQAFVPRAHARAAGCCRCARPVREVSSTRRRVSARGRRDRREGSSTDSRPRPRREGLATPRRRRESS